MLIMVIQSQQPIQILNQLYLLKAIKVSILLLLIMLWSKNYEVETKLGKGLKYDENGAIAATAQAVKGGNGVTEP